MSYWQVGVLFFTVLTELLTKQVVEAGKCTEGVD
jgi:hypothetical protein